MLAVSGAPAMLRVLHAHPINTAHIDNRCAPDREDVRYPSDSGQARSASEVDDSAMEKTLTDMLWLALCAGLVFNMQIGFLCLESGLTRSKNAINVAIKNVADLSISILLYWLFGFALMFGTSQGGLIGTDHFMPEVSGLDPWPMAFFVFQAMFCTTAATIISGAAAERMRFNAYLLISALGAGLIYPIFGHWAWGGTFSSGQGWLSARGFVDFAGSTVVHSVGGWMALAVVLVIGARQGRFDGRQGVRTMPGSNLPLAMLGGLLLMFGWFGFNGGSTLAFDARVPGIVVNTLLGAVAGIAGAMAISWWRNGYVEAVAPLNGMLAGLVAVTASAHAITASAAFTIGLGGAAAMCVAESLLVRWRIDDAVGAVPVHLAAGIWGTFAVALFGDPAQLGTGLGFLAQLRVQVEGIVTCGLWAFGVTYAALRVLDRHYPLRVTPEDELRGLNVAEHGARTELIELLTVMEEHQRQGHFHKEVEVEPFTEVGQIASQYNKVLRALQKAVNKTQTIVRDIRDGIVTYTADGVLASCNPGAERLFGLPADQVIGRQLQQFVSGGAGALQSLFPAPGGESKFELTLRGQNGKPFAAELTASHGADEDGLYICMLRDVTERRRVEEQLFQEKMLAQITLASIGDGVITTDRHGHIRYLNPMAVQLTGWTLAEAEGKPLTDVYRLSDEATGAPLPSPLQHVSSRAPASVRLGQTTSSVLHQRDGRTVAVQDAVAPIRNAEEEIIGVVLTFRDVTVTRQLAQELSFQASHDNLTGLLNRSAFERRIEELVSRPEDERGEHVLCYMDLDQFKVVNDTCGHAAGDELLRQLAQIFKGRVRSTDVLARLGGDEFGIVFLGCPIAQAVQVADGIRRTVEEFRFSWEGKTFAVGVSIGLVQVDGHHASVGSVTSAADSACYAAKDAGRNRVHVYQPDDVHLIERRGEMQWTGRIRRALDADQFRLYVQPIVATQGSGAEPRYEVLLRLLDSDGSVIPPGAFMPAAERYDLAAAIDRWVISNFLGWLGDYCRRRHGPLGHYSINVCGASLGDEDFLAFVLDAIEENCVPPQILCFELTETSAIANLNRAMVFMKRVKEIGCSFALDDFGCGLSSFAYLKTLPVDYLKIDGVFVKEIVDDPIACAMVKSINSGGHEMGLKTVAEFVESAAILEHLKEIGVDYCQGYHIGRPRPLAELVGVRMMPR